MRVCGTGGGRAGGDERRPDSSAGCNGCRGCGGRWRRGWRPECGIAGESFSRSNVTVNFLSTFDSHNIRVYTNLLKVLKCTPLAPPQMVMRLKSVEWYSFCPRHTLNLLVVLLSIINN